MGSVLAVFADHTQGDAVQMACEAKERRTARIGFGHGCNPALSNGVAHLGKSNPGG